MMVIVMAVVTIELTAVMNNPSAGDCGNESMKTIGSSVQQ